MLRVTSRSHRRSHMEDMIDVVLTAYVRSVHSLETAVGPVGGGTCPPLPSAKEVAAMPPTRNATRISRATQMFRRRCFTVRSPQVEMSGSRARVGLVARPGPCHSGVSLEQATCRTDTVTIHARAGREP